MPYSRHIPRRVAARATFPLGLATLLLGLATLSGCGSASSASATKHPSAITIRLQEIAIHPAKVTIERGSTVTWQWLDGNIDTSHNVTSLPGGPQFKPSGTRLTGSYTVRFNKPGKYFYECTIHPASMRGEIVVE
jgi:plastocyanin